MSEYYLQGPLVNSVFTDVVYFAEHDGRTNSGDPIIGVKKSAPARIERENELVLTTDGNQVVSSHKIATRVEIPMESFVWITEDTSPEKAFRPITQKYAKSPSGMVIYEVKL